MLLLVWSIEPCLNYSTAVLTQSTKFLITTNENMIWPITALPQSLLPPSILVKVYMDMKGQHEHGNSYKGKCVIG